MKSLMSFLEAQYINSINEFKKVKPRKDDKRKKGKSYCERYSF